VARLLSPLVKNVMACGAQVKGGAGNAAMLFKKARMGTAYQLVLQQQKGAHLALSRASSSSADAVHIILHPLKSGGKVVVDHNLNILRHYEQMKQRKARQNAP